MGSLRSIVIQGLEITFHRTCRVPQARGLTSDLPISVGGFPIFKVSDFRGNVPNDWKEEGHFIPMWPQEAMWIGFNTPNKPVAVVVGAGMVNALTGSKLTSTLSVSPQNYIVAPPQPWIDGFKPTQGERVFQFVATQLGSGETAEEQLLGTSEFGGLQFGVFKSRIPLVNRWARTGAFPPPTLAGSSMRMTSRGDGIGYIGATIRPMGLGAGGAIKQKIYPDPFLEGRSVNEVWEEEPVEKAYVYIVHSADFKSITGQEPPASPISYETYQKQGLPWVLLPDGTWGDVEGGKAIDSLKPVSSEPQVNPKTKNLW